MKNGKKCIVCGNEIDRDSLKHLEKSKYCCRKCYGVDRTNYRHTKETKEKIIESNKTRSYSKETREKLRQSAFKRNFGKNPKPFSKERCKQISEYRKDFFVKGGKPPMQGKKHTKETKLKISKKAIGRFIGEKSPTWKGGKTGIKKRIREYSLYKNWRTSVFERDKYTCLFCGQIGGVLNADHKKPFAIIIGEMLDRKEDLSYENISKNEELWNIKNGRTLCLKCHRSIKSISFKQIKEYEQQKK